jgi:hypothetical protein
MRMATKWLDDTPGRPDSSKNSGSFDGMQGRFFSSPTANEVILQVEFAKDLSNNPGSLLRQELILRYAERQALGPNASDTTDNAREPSGGFSVVPKELRLKIVGVVETEPAAGYGGYGNARVLMPLNTAATLRAAPHGCRTSSWSNHFAIAAVAKAFQWSARSRKRRLPRRFG